MKTIDWEKHYTAFKWAVSKDWKEKKELHRSIQFKITTLTEEFNLSEQEIIDVLFEHCWKRKHYLKFDETKGSLNNWIAYYVKLNLNNLIRKYAVRAKEAGSEKLDPLDQRNWANLEWIDKENIREDPDYQTEIAFDTTTPEGLCIAKGMLEFAHTHFHKNEIAYLMGEMELDEAAELSGCSSDVFRKRISRRVDDFRVAVKEMEH